MAKTTTERQVQMPSPTDLYNIDHLLNEEERMVRDTVRKFVQERVLPIIGELVPARMTQHVRMHWERKLCALPRPHDHLAISRGRNRCGPLGHEHEAAFDLLALELPQRPQLGTAQGLHGRRSIFRAPHMHEPRAKSIMSHRNVQSSDGRSPWRNATRIIVASQCP